MIFEHEHEYANQSAAIMAIAPKIGCGIQVATETSSGHYSFNRKWLTRRGLSEKSLSVISVRGDSMEPD